MKKEMLDAIRAAEIALINTPEGEVIKFEDMLFRTSFGVLTEGMSAALGEVVKGKRVFDIEAGDCSMSKKMLELGANHVVAIDKEMRRGKDKNISRHRFYIHTFLAREKDLPEPGDVAFLSWPANHATLGLISLLSRFDTVVYLGKNTNNTSCGFPELFFDMLKRPLLKHIGHPKNTMLILGKRTDGIVRCPTLEELGGLDHGNVYEWKEGL